MSKKCGKSYLYMQKTTENKTKVGLIPVFCKSWSCPVCRKKKADQVRAFIKTKFCKQQSWMLTFTYKRNKTALDCWKGIGKNVNRMLAYARKEKGEFEYVRIVEPHKEGSWPHVHMLVNRPIASTGFVKNVTKWGFGWNFHCEKMEGNKAGNYMAKYLTKEWPKGNADLYRQISKTRIVSSSRSLGPIFTTKPSWTLVKLPNPWKQLTGLKSATITELQNNGATEITVKPISDGFIIEADSYLSPGFVECIEDQFQIDPAERSRFVEHPSCMHGGFPIWRIKPCERPVQTNAPEYIGIT